MRAPENKSRWWHYAGLCFSIGFDQLYLWTTAAWWSGQGQSQSPLAVASLFPTQQQLPGLCRSWEFCSLSAPQPHAWYLQKQRWGQHLQSWSPLPFPYCEIRYSSLAYFSIQRNLIGFIIAAFAYISITAGTEQNYFYITVPIGKGPSVSHLRHWQEAFCWWRDCSKPLSMPFVWWTLYQPGDLASCLSPWWHGLPLKGKNLWIYVCVELKRCCFINFLTEFWAKLI